MRTFWAACWSAKILVKAASPARKTAEVGNIGLGSNAHAVEMLMMAPLRCFTVAGVTTRGGGELDINTSETLCRDV
jgi:hypothetical protein